MSLSKSVPLSVLDLAPVPSGSTAGQALRNSIDLAQHVEAWGYRRFWVAEHHNMPGIASSAPAVLIGHLASATHSLRVGSGGVMLPNHAPLVVAEQFGMLEALHPGRIDLGLGRAPGTDQVTAMALRRSVEALSADDFPEQLSDLMGFFDGEWPEGHPFKHVRAVPALGNQPVLWLLGSSGYSAQVAGLLGLPFAFAHHFSAANTEPALQLYRDCFRPSSTLGAPYALIGVAVVCADTTSHARYLHGSAKLSLLRLRSGHPGQLPNPTEAAAYTYTPSDRLTIENFSGSHVVGDPPSVARQLDELMARTGADELMITTNIWDHAERLRSFELVAEVTGLGERSASASSSPPNRDDQPIPDRSSAR
jgi:luciferase family oxidoreductase group 1